METSITNIKITTKNYDVWITPAQHAAIRKLYDRLEERPTFEFFLSSCMAEYHPERTNETVAVPLLIHWCNMLIGIEKDGYTHS